MAPEAENRITLDTHEFVAPAVVRTVSVLAAVDFDDELRLATAEIGEVWAYGELPRKFVPCKLAPLQFKPKQSLSLILSLS
jgi:hypothetical protein